MNNNINILTQVIKVNSQLDRLNDIASVMQVQTNYGDIIFNSSGGTINYTAEFSDVINLLSSWANMLLSISQDPVMGIYVSGDNLDVNSWNTYYNNLSTTDQATYYVSSTLINQNYSVIKNLKTTYLYDINLLTGISQTGKDNIYILATGSTFTSFQTMVGMLQSFYTNIILNITNYNSSTLLTQTTILVKFNNALPLINITS